MKQIYCVEPAEAKRRGFFSFFRKNKVREIFLAQYGDRYYAFGEDADVLSYYYRTESSDRFECKNASVASKKLHIVIKELTYVGYRLKIKARISY